MKYLYKTGEIKSGNAEGMPPKNGLAPIAELTDEAVDKVKALVKQAKSAGLSGVGEWAFNRARFSGVNGINIYRA